MAELNFAQPARRNLMVPILIAASVLGVAGGWMYHAIPQTDADVAITGVVLHPIRTVYKRPTNIAPGYTSKVHDVSEADLYVIPTVRIEDHLGVSLDLKDFTVSLITQQGELHASAVEQGDLAAVYQAFPEINPLMGKPMLRETSVPARQSVEGTLLLQFPVPEKMWEQRHSATLTVDFYRQPSITIPFPKP